MSSLLFESFTLVSASFLVYLIEAILMTLWWLNFPFNIRYFKGFSEIALWRLTILNYFVDMYAHIPVWYIWLLKKEKKKIWSLKQVGEGPSSICTEGVCNLMMSYCYENPHLVLHPDSQITCCMDSSSNDFSLPEAQQDFFWGIVFDKSILIVVISCWVILFSLPLSQSSPLFSTSTCCLSNCSKGQAEFPQLKNIFISSQNKLYLQLNHKREHL